MLIIFLLLKTNNLIESIIILSYHHFIFEQNIPQQNIYICNKQFIFYYFQVNEPDSINIIKIFCYFFFYNV